MAFNQTLLTKWQIREGSFARNSTTNSITMQDSRYVQRDEYIVIAPNLVILFSHVI